MIYQGEKVKFQEGSYAVSIDGEPTGGHRAGQPTRLAAGVYVAAVAGWPAGRDTSRGILASAQEPSLVDASWVA